MEEGVGDRTREMAVWEVTGSMLLTVNLGEGVPSQSKCVVWKLDRVREPNYQEKEQSWGDTWSWLQGDPQQAFGPKNC